MNLTKTYDVLIAGGGNAALCAAITARSAGASVLVLEHAPVDMRGGNSRHTRNLRVAHAQPTATLTGSYSEDEYWNDLKERDARQDGRAAGAHGDSRDGGAAGMDGVARRAFSAVAGGHVEFGAHQFVFSGWRQGADERLLRLRGENGRCGDVRDGSEGAAFNGGAVGRWQ